MVRFARSVTNTECEISHSTAQGTPQQEHSTSKRVGDQVCDAQLLHNQNVNIRLSMPKYCTLRFTVRHCSFELATVYSTTRGDHLHA